MTELLRDTEPDKLYWFFSEESGYTILKRIDWGWEGKQFLALGWDVPVDPDESGMVYVAPVIDPGGEHAEE